MAFVAADVDEKPLPVLLIPVDQNMR